MAAQIFLHKTLSRWNNFIDTHPHDYKAYIQRGMVKFKLAAIDEAIADFDRAEKLEPNITPYLWQRGLAYYYAKRYEEGAKQFEIDLSVNRRDSEETIWRYLCIARYQGIIKAQNSLIIVKNDPRPIMHQVLHLYAGNRTVDDVLTVGEREGKQGKFYSSLYLGLYYEARAEEAKAKEYIIKAATNYQIDDDYMWYLACVHQQIRGWN